MQIRKIKDKKKGIFSSLQRNRKADISSQQLVILIILIASFAVILFFLLRLNLGKTTAKEVCHNSVVSRSSGVIPTEATPLNCKTNYVCLTKDGSCEAMSGKKETRKAKTKEEAYDIIADEMSDCWWTFGEGKVNYIGEELFPSLYCSVCSQLAFDDSLKEIFTEGKIDKKQFYDYLALKKTSSNTSYLEYLTGLKSSQDIITTLNLNSSGFGEINLDKQSYIVMGVYSKISLLQWIAAGAGIGILVVVTGGGIVPFLLVAGGGGTAGYFIGTVVEGKSGNQYLSPTVIEANSADFNSLQCKDIKTLA